MAPSRVNSENPSLEGLCVLVVEDEVLLRKELESALKGVGASVSAVGNLAAARRAAEEGGWDLLLLDVNLPDGNGLDFLGEGRVPETVAPIVMTAAGNMETVIKALRLGAADYLAKPFSVEELPFICARVLAQRKKRRLDDFRERQTDAEAFLMEGLGRDFEAQLEAILEADRRLELNLPPVLLEGETGTGKTTLARWIHRNGPRAGGPLVEVNCSTLPDALAESELFGHEKGAFTDAKSARMGLFEAADGGTLFLDEVVSLSPAVQAKVLSVVEDGVIRRLGGNRSIRVDVRLIAAALPTIHESVRRGEFREDLYHRLDLLHLRLPPLRERPDSLFRIAEFLLRQLGKRYRREDAAIGEAAKARMLGYEWPGNVRELRHELERALIFSRGGDLDLLAGRTGGAADTVAASADDLLNPLWSVPENFRFEEALESLTLRVIENALEACEGNVSAAARKLGVPRDFIRYRLQTRIGGNSADT